MYSTSYSKSLTRASILSGASSPSVLGGEFINSQRGHDLNTTTSSTHASSLQDLLIIGKPLDVGGSDTSRSTLAEGSDYRTSEVDRGTDEADRGTDEADNEKEEGSRERKRRRTWEDGPKRKKVRQGFQDWNSSGSYSPQSNFFFSSSCLTLTFADCFGHIYCDDLWTTKPISTDLLQRPPCPDDSVPHSESIQEHLYRLDEMALSESRILLLEKIHQEMWAQLPTMEFIKWDDLPWPVFSRTTCPEDLMLHRIVSYLLQISSGMDINEALMDSNRLQWAQQRLRILLGHWGQPGLQKKVENSADKIMIQGVNVVTNHLESILDFMKAHQIGKTHHTDLTAIVSQTFLKHVGENLARILIEKSSYKSLLKLVGDSAQKMLNLLQMVRHVTAQYHHESHYL